MILHPQRLHITLHFGADFWVQISLLVCLPVPDPRHVLPGVGVQQEHERVEGLALEGHVKVGTHDDDVVADAD